MGSKKIVLHVGCGKKEVNYLYPTFKTDEWQELRLDIDPDVSPDIVNSITDMKDVEDESVDAVFSSHNLEHLYHHEVTVALKEFYRVIKHSGFVLILVPDIQIAVMEVAKGNLEGFYYQSPLGPISPIDVIWGFRKAIKEGNNFMAHKTGFTSETLKDKLLNAGFLTARMEKRDIDIMAISTKIKL
jgi:ubiquinone/menaquinone biosynthesis C-methylase UbiE